MNDAPVWVMAMMSSDAVAGGRNQRQAPRQPCAAHPAERPSPHHRLLLTCVGRSEVEGRQGKSLTSIPLRIIRGLKPGDAERVWGKRQRVCMNLSQYSFVASDL
jgi:hypothetical protein